MNTNQKQLGAVIALMGAVSVISGHWMHCGSSHYELVCVVTVLTCLCMSIMTIMMTRKYIHEQGCWVIMLIAMGQSVKALVMLDFIYMKLVQHQIPPEGIILGLQGRMIDCACLLFNVVILCFKWKEFKNSYVINTIYIVICLYCLLLRKPVMIVLLNISGKAFIIFFVYAMVFWGRIEKKWIGMKLPYMRLYFLIAACEYGMMILLKGKMGSHYFYQYLLEAFRALVLFSCAYHSNLKEPWKAKMDEMKMADFELQDQDKCCEKIVDFSHELKTPVNVVKSALMILSMDFKEPDMAGEMFKMKQDCRHIMNMIQDMIDIQKIRGGYIQFQPHSHNMVELIDDVADGFSVQGYHGRIISDPSEEEIYDLVDKDMLEKAFMLMAGFFLEQEEKSEVIFEIEKNTLNQQIVVTMTSVNMTRLNCSFDDAGQLGEEASVSQLLTFQLIRLIIKMHEGKMQIEKSKDGYRIIMIFSCHGEVENNLCEEEDTGEIREQIRCRYKVS